MNVLLVDDDRLVLEGLRAMLPWDDLGVQTLELAEDGMEALCMARVNHPDVVITDICMPRMDGLELVETLCNEELYPEIFLLSGHDEFEYARRAMRYGVKHYLLKPVTRQTIQQLEADIRNLRESLVAKKAQQQMLGSAKYEERLLRSLAQGDVAVLENTFQELEAQLRIAPDNIIAMCLWLLDILYRHLDGLHMDELAAKRSRKNSVDEMLALESREDKLFFVEQKYFSVAQSHMKKAESPHLRIASKAREIINQRFTQPEFSIASLADELGLTASYVSTVFSQAEGISLSMYLTELRLEQARRLLSTTVTPIWEIARICGYIDGHYFAKIFKKKYGLTPSEFRNLCVQQEKKS